MSRIRTQFVSLLFAGLLGAHGGAQMLDLNDPGPFDALLPSLKSAPAPSWLKKGMRLTYHSISATIAGSGKNWKQDDNGNWQTADGQRWSGEDKASGSSNGYVQVDVAALGPRTAALLVTYYMIPPTGGSPMVMLQYPVVGPSGSVGGFWVNPSALAKIKTQNGSVLKVFRMPYRSNGKSVPAVWIKTSARKNNKLYVYDVKTGVLLHDSLAIEGADPKVIASTEPSNTASTTLADGRLVQQRAVSYPWKGGSWKKPGGSLSFNGRTVVQVSGCQPMGLAHALSASPIKSGEGFIVHKCQSQIQSVGGMPPQTQETYLLSGLAGFGGAWLPPSSLSKLQSGQKLDYDPVTGVTVSVLGANNQAVMIGASNQSQSYRFGYSKSTGYMVFYERSDRTATSVQTTQLATQ